ncbi:HPF/RaiA family ribosome-associated protein [Rhodoferax sp.]|uniref:HPF/RaiA family ribosome-associated protein n=1 Tax=Rhodoferax sp. TaxID=50421 RepID=UPI00374CDB28
MQIQINTDHNIEGREALASHVTGMVQHALQRLSAHITRVEVHLSDENSDKNAHHDKRCLLEARLEGRPPVAVTHHADTLHKAVDGANDKLIRKIDDLVHKLHDQKTRSDAVIAAAVLPDA